ncbi:hypothetical protein K474DRAFT_1657462 [Panus rudis PR-1116 ss-1]|nr:hypothetical protein K474DRAFT_1657462 [Panus rudis PR-1116 ss-1]
MALFEVPGWTVPAAPVASASPPKKRKRSESTTNDDKLHTAAVNVEKLIASLDNGDGNANERKSKKQKRVRKPKQQPVKADGEGTHEPVGPSSEARPPKPKKNKKQSPKADVSSSSAAQISNEQPQLKRQKAPAKKSAAGAPASPSKSAPEEGSSKAPQEEKEGLTALQSKLKHSLDGARFRWINEKLYKSDSHEAHQLMKENPSVFEEYHTGFRHQVQTWPSNPVSHYISVLSKYPPKTVIADLGCGEAALAKALVPKGFIVLSFDLISDGRYIIEADICSKVPLPGSEEIPEGNEDTCGGQVVDVVICALSLMGTNWPTCIREARRILKEGGELKIAEVASRFTNIDAFCSLISSIGFKLKSKDDSNSHFTLFEFVRIKRKPKSEKEWEKLMSKGDLLKPCEYKRR